MKYFYLHGLGQKPDSWDRTIKRNKSIGQHFSIKRKVGLYENRNRTTCFKNIYRNGL